MSFSLSIPTSKTKGVLNLVVNEGQMLFVLGANGTGKSSLLQAFASADSGKTRRISAHRQTWFRSGAPEFAGRQRAEYEGYFFQHDRMPGARWMDNYSEQRAQVAIYDLINAENLRARQIMYAVDGKKEDEVKRLSDIDSALTALNRLLLLSNLEIVLSVEDNDEIMATRKGSKPYSIAKLSDGERNAILIAANVLTAPPGTLLLIDEPERHLHRSIVSPLLTLLFKERKDCSFVVSTHEPLLPIDNPASSVLLTRSCVYDGDVVRSYDVDFLEDIAGIDDELLRTILGERRKIVFVEGEEHSLDKPLYSLLFPNASIVAKSNCRSVEDAVVGIKSTAQLHWIEAFGVVDNDASELERIGDLHAKGVIPLDVYSVESIYYHPDIQRLAAKKILELIGGNLEEKLEKAKKDAISAIRNNAKHLSERIAEKVARSKVFALLPKKGEIASGKPRNIVIDFPEYIRDEEARIKVLLDASDLVGLMKRYPVRESRALDAIVKALDCKDRDYYESVVLNLLARNPEAVKMVRTLLGPLPTSLIA